MNYANPWTGKRQFYRGKQRKRPSEEQDRDYQLYIKNKKNRSRALSYAAWCRRQRRQQGVF